MGKDINKTVDDKLKKFKIDIASKDTYTREIICRIEEIASKYEDENERLTDTLRANKLSFTMLAKELHVSRTTLEKNHPDIKEYIVLRNEELRAANPVRKLEDIAETINEKDEIIQKLEERDVTTELQKIDIKLANNKIEELKSELESARERIQSLNKQLIDANDEIIELKKSKMS